MTRLPRPKDQPPRPHFPVPDRQSRGVDQIMLAPDSARPLVLTVVGTIVGFLVALRLLDLLTVWLAP